MIANFAAESPENTRSVEVRTWFAKAAILTPEEQVFIEVKVAKYEAITIDQVANLFQGRTLDSITEEENDCLDFWIASMPGNDQWIEKLKSAGKYLPEVVKLLNEISANMPVNLSMKYKEGKLSLVERRVLDLWGTFSAENIVFLQRALRPDFGMEDNCFII